jgi:NmrA-like family
MSKCPSIAVIGANGYIGKLVVPYLYDALKNNRLRELRILTRSVNAADENFAKAKGGSVHQVTYSQPETLVEALTGVDVVISNPRAGIANGYADMMGLQGEDWEKNKEILVDTIAKTGVSVYIPSEFGTYHYVSNYQNHPMFKLKAHHFEEAKRRVEKIVGIFTGLMMEQMFSRDLGFDNEKEVWTVVGNGDVPVSVLSNADAGHFTVEAAILAYEEPEKIPDKLVISSATMTFQQYAEVLDTYTESGNKTKIVGKPLAQAKADWEVMKRTVPVFMVLSYPVRLILRWDPCCSF